MNKEITKEVDGRLEVNADVKIQKFYIYDPLTGKSEIIEFKMRNFKINYVYPSDYFKTKPTVSYNREDLEKGICIILGNLKKMLAEDTIDINLIKIYLISYYTNRCIVPTKKEWSSFGNIFVPDNLKEDIEINPMILLDSNFDVPSIKLKNISVPAIPKILDSYAAVCLGLSRINDTTYPDHKNKILDKLARLIGNNVPEKDRGMLLEMYDTNKTLSMDKDYKKLVAAFDMFICHFQDIDLTYSKLRQMTIHTHYKDCNALALCNKTMIQTTLQADFPCWLWQKQLLADFERIYKPDQEHTQKDSYTAWLSFLGLVRNNPFSAAANPSLTFFCHALGLILGTSWSTNAIMPDCFPDPLIENAALVIYAIGQIIGIDKAKMSVDQKIKKGHGEMPKTLNADDWGIYVRSQSSDAIPDFMIEYYVNCTDNIDLTSKRKNALVDAISEFVKKYRRIKSSKKAINKAYR